MRQKLKQLFQIQKVLQECKYPDYVRVANEVYEFCDGDENKIVKVLERIKSNEPWEYIRGYTEFCGFKFVTNKSTLIPRIETEQLVDIACSLMKERGFERVIDVGTGTGCIIISICKMLDNEEIEYIATDISKDALQIAKINAKENCVEKRIRFIETNLLDGVQIKENTLIVANLPYIPTSIYKKLDRSVLDYEPILALDGGVDGMKYYKELIEDIKDRYKGMKNFSILIEIDPTIVNELHALQLKEMYVIKDQNNLERFALINLS